jgi:two-component sensor histidine kinase
MIDFLRFVRAERDLAARLITVTRERDAIGATADSLLELVPRGGVAVSSEADGAPWFEIRGPGAEAALKRLRDAEPVSGPGIHCYAAAVPVQHGAGGALVVLAESDKTGDLSLDCSVGRIALLLAGALNRIRSPVAGAEERADRELLVRELRHRTRNSLQMIKSTVSFLIRNSLDGVSARYLETLDERLCALVSVHEMLSWTGSSGEVSAEAYFNRLAQELRRLAPPDAGFLVADYAAEDDVSLPIDRAATIGLIVNELVTNSVKHASREPAAMKLRVDFRNGSLVLEYSDSPGADRTPAAGAEAAAAERPPRYSAGGMGLELIDALVLRARGERVDSGGAPHRFVARFPVS